MMVFAKVKVIHINLKRKEKNKESNITTYNKTNPESTSKLTRQFKVYHIC